MSLPTVLLIDDNAFIRRVIGEYLRRCGCSVTPAANGAEALEIYRRDAQDIVLLDAEMPAMSGLATLGALKEINPDVVCCLMSGKLQDGDLQRFTEAGVTSVLAKPFLPAGLRRLIMRLDVRRRSPTDSPAENQQ